jgi:hypothetical protein
MAFPIRQRAAETPEHRRHGRGRDEREADQLRLQPVDIREQLRAEEDEREPDPRHEKHDREPGHVRPVAKQAG